MGNLFWTHPTDIVSELRGAWPNILKKGKNESHTDSIRDKHLIFTYKMILYYPNTKSIILWWMATIVIVLSVIIGLQM